MANEFQGMDTAAILAQRAEEVRRQTKPTEFVFDPRKYLNTRLEPNETTKTIVIRLLPFSKTEQTPFHKVHVHSVKVNNEIAKSGFKRFICPQKNVPEVQEGPCPYCEVTAEARKKRDEAITETEKKMYDEIVMNNRGKDAWIVRCIERGHEEDGVKFWMFSNAKDGIFNDMLTLDERRRESAARDGEPNYSIFSLNNGKDLEITIKRDGKKQITTIMDSEKRTPLTNDYNLGVSWIEDPTKWTDLFRVKSYDFMSIALQGDVPIWDKDEKKFIGKKEKEEREKGVVKDRENQVTKEFDEMAVTPEVYETAKAFPDMMVTQTKVDISDDEDDLPF